MQNTRLTPIFSSSPIHFPSCSTASPNTSDNPAEKRRGVHQWKYHFIFPISFCAFYFMSICVSKAICLQNCFNGSIPSQNVSTSQIYPTVPFLSSRYLWIKQMFLNVPKYSHSYFVQFCLIFCHQNHDL